MLAEVGPSRTEEPELGYGQLLQILWRRLYWVVGGLIGGLSLAAIATLLLPPKYESTMQLLIEPNVKRSVSLNDPEQGQRGGSFQEVELDYVTQLNLMRSKPFIDQALTLLETGVPDLCKQEDTREDCIETFEEDFSLAQVEEDKSNTRIFEAVFTSNNKLRAQKSLQALRSVYLAYNLDQQSDRLTEGLELVDQQIAEVRQDLNRSQNSLQAFRQGEGLIDPEQQSLSAAEALDALALEQQEVRAEYEEAIAQESSIRSVLALDPRSAVAASRASQSSRYQSLLDALQKTELALAERLSVYTEADPVVQDLEAERSRNVALLRQESQRLVRQTGGGSGYANESDLLSSGQLGDIDLNLVEEMIANQVRIKSLEARQLSLARSEQRLQDKLVRFPGLINQYDKLQPEVETQRQSLAQLLELRQQLSNDIAQGGFKWEVVEPPAIGEKVSPNPIQNLALGAIAGLFIGGALAYWREASDTVLRSSEALSKQTTLPLLGGLPEDVEGSPKRRSFGWWRQVLPPVEDSVLSRVQWESFRDAIDLIYKNIQLSVEASRRGFAGEYFLRDSFYRGAEPADAGLTDSAPQEDLAKGPVAHDSLSKDRSLKSLMVTSATAGEGKTTLAMGLALSAARSQKRVLLIDADLRNPTIHEQLGLANNQGLTQLLVSLEAPVPVNVALSGVEIDILTAGPLSDDPVLLLNSHRMKELVAKFERQYDLVIFDTSALLGRVDALQIASLCDSVVVISRLNQVAASDLKKVAAVLGPVNVLGVVANGCDDIFSIHTPAPLLVREPAPLLAREPLAAISRTFGGPEGELNGRSSEAAQNGLQDDFQNGLQNGRH